MTTIESDRTIRRASVGRGSLPRRMRKPVIYFAGRMDSDQNNHDWRRCIEGFDPYHHGWDIPNPDQIIDFGDFWYGGPFHCGDSGSHSSGHGWQDSVGRQQIIWAVDRFQIERADLIVAYLYDKRAHGTLVEIGYAAGKGKPIALMFSDDLPLDDYTDLWLCRMPAMQVYFGSASTTWRRVKRDWVA